MSLSTIRVGFVCAIHGLQGVAVLHRTAVLWNAVLGQEDLPRTARSSGEWVYIDQ